MSTSWDERLKMSMLMKNPKLEDEIDETAGSSSLTISYQQQIRPLLDAVDKLRNLNIMNEGIQLPSIVVVGDQSHGKSSVLESLAGIKLPRGMGICTRVPLIMRLQSCSDKSEAQISIEYSGKKEIIKEWDITSEIKAATQEIAGGGKGISYTPITLHITKVGAPDLTMVDLPGIARVAVDGQPADIYEQISEMIMEYIKPTESIILNVLAATVDFPTCESIRMSQTVDPNGERTLAVVTKCDKAPEGLLEKVTVDAVNIGLGYVCVRNGIGDETNAEARQREKQLFDSHPLLKKIDKEMVGIPLLAEKLMQIQATTINTTLPQICNQIDDMLAKRQSELSSLPQHLCNRQEADVAFVKLLNEIKESLKKIVILGEFQQFPDDPQMHCTARLREMFDKFYKELCQSGAVSTKFLAKETQMLGEAKGVGLPNFLPRSVFLDLLQQMVEEVSDRGLGIASTVWQYLETVINRVIEHYCQCYPQLRSRVQRAVQGLVVEKKQECTAHVKQMLEMEKGIDFTLSPAYMETYGRLIQSKGQFTDRLNLLIKDSGRGYTSGSGYNVAEKTVVLDDFGEVDVADIMEMPSERVEEAYEMQMSVMAYWKVVILRMGDGIPLHLQFVCRKLVGRELESQILKEVGGPNFGAMEKIMEESPMVATKRKSLINSLQLLKDSKTAVANIMDRVAEAA
ncbi:dynamin-related protein 4C [Cryptomeria japonica]|uniref:dynamin-related protein 4C n=1 Tax=Cryptomeria japonica TaxID=3369 RepID=UPI0027D9CFCF|nr:dynamin-related protein 4C [Cryptomeria japonica]